jgi:biotin carboxyl carrier protein
MIYDISICGKIHRLELSRIEGSWQFRLDGIEISADVEQIDTETLSVLVGGKSFEVRREADGRMFLHGRHYDVTVDDPRSWRGRKRAGTGNEGPHKLTASMPGRIVRVLASEGDKISAGQGIAVVEAMKMQNEIKSPKQGTLKKLLARAGMSVQAGEVLAVVE